MSEETTLFKGSPSPIIKLGTFLLCGIIFVAAVVFSFLVSVWLVILAGIVLVYMLAQWILIKSRVYELTTERIRVRTGLFTKRTDELELYRVQDVTLIEPFVERVMGLGNIFVTTNDASTPNLELEAIKGARELREQMRKSVEACRDKKRVRVTELE